MLSYFKSSLCFSLKEENALKPGGYSIIESVGIENNLMVFSKKTSLYFEFDFSKLNTTVSDEVVFWLKIADNILKKTNEIREYNMFISLLLAADSEQCSFSLVIPPGLPSIEIFWDIYFSGVD